MGGLLSTETEQFSTMGTIQPPTASFLLFHIGASPNWRGFGLLLQSAIHVLFRSLRSVALHKPLRTLTVVTTEFGCFLTEVDLTLTSSEGCREKYKLLI